MSTAQEQAEKFRESRQVTYWIKGSRHFSYGTASVVFEQGTKGGGKSEHLEYFAKGHLAAGNCVIDGHAANDNENLAHLRDPDNKDRRILLLRGPNSSVTASWPDKSVKDLSLDDFMRYDLIIAPPCNFYPRPQAVYDAINHIVDLLYYRESYDRLIYLLVREASSLWYSRVKLEWAQLEMKARMIYMLREMRHSGVSLGLDTMKDKSIDADIRNLIDFLYLRKQGAAGLSDDLNYVYSFFDPEYMQRMPSNEFVVRTKEGDIGWGKVPWLPWHKVEGENLRKDFGLKVEHSDPEPEQPKNSLSDEEHARIVHLYREKDEAGKRRHSMAKLAIMLSRSPTTIQNELAKHDAAIEINGLCQRCKSALGTP